jgi:hypothetical protein
LPCWRHLAPEDQRAQVQALLRAIDEEGAEEHQRAGTRPLGAAAIAASDPYARVARQPADAAPAVIARSKEVRDDWRARQQEQTARWIALATAVVQRLKALGLALWTGANWWTVGGALRRLARALARLEPAENCS